MEKNNMKKCNFKYLRNPKDKIRCMLKMGITDNFCDGEECILQKILNYK